MTENINTLRGLIFAISRIFIIFENWLFTQNNPREIVKFMEGKLQLLNFIIRNS